MSDEVFDHDNTLEFGEEDFGEGEEVRKEEGVAESDRETMSLSSSPSSNRRVKEMPIDRLSDLPDLLLIHILSFLGVKKARITSVLSKRWESLWAEVPSLEFWEDGTGDVIDFVSWVNSALDIRKGDYLEKFVVIMNSYDEGFASDVNAWVEYSVKNEVKELMLLMYSPPYYEPPQMICSCSSLTNLKLARCIMPSESTIKWKSLTRLSIQDSVLSQHLIDEILSSCPVLNRLELEDCVGFDRLEVNSRCLNHLRVQECEDEPEDDPVEISAPYVCHLDIEMFPQGRKWQIKNISSVFEASIDFFQLYGEFPDAVMSNSYEFLEKFKHVNKLYIGSRCFKVLSRMAMNDWKLPQLRLQNLTLASHSEYKLCIAGIIAMLESSPKLEALLLKGYKTNGYTFKLDPAAKVDLDGDLLHLKSIRVNNFADPNGEPLLTLARFLLRRAPALEEMMIVIDVEDTSDFVNIAKKLLTYPRSSAKAQIHLISRKLFSGSKNLMLKTCDLPTMQPSFCCCMSLLLIATLIVSSIFKELCSSNSPTYCIIMF